MRCATSTNSASCAIRDAQRARRRPRARRASRARPTARRPRRARRAPPPAGRAARRASGPSRAWWAIMPSTSRCPDSANSSPTRKRCSGGLPGAEQPHAARPPRAGSGLVVVLAGLQRDVVAEPLRLLVRVGVTADVDRAAPCSRRPRAPPRRARSARRAAARSGTGAARAPSAARSRDRSRATARRPARPAEPARDRAAMPQVDPIPPASLKRPTRESRRAPPRVACRRRRERVRHYRGSRSGAPCRPRRG